MAPGGYTSGALKYNPTVKVYGITLRATKGGHEVLLGRDKATIEYLDLTMLATEFGTGSVPETHPEHEAFLTKRPFLNLKFDPVFCDGQVLREHQCHRAEYRELKRRAD